MRALILFLLAAMPYSSSFGQNYSMEEILDKMPKFISNGCPLPTDNKLKFQNDAARLALRIIREKVPMEQRKIEIDSSLQQSLFNALLAVRCSGYSAVDSIYRIYEIKTYPNISLESWVVLLEPQAQWGTEYPRESDYAYYGLSQQYKLQTSDTKYLDEHCFSVTLKSSKPIDIEALAYFAKTEYQLNSITELINPFGDGNDIRAHLTEQGWEIAYSVRFGNCVNQCQKAFTWRFLVKHKGEVTYLGNGGDIIPPWITTVPRSGRYPNVLKSN